ncbi:MAG: hypothetical protein MI866_18490 [Bacteroidales bacterium]|nr:hypothetical protein [Bacteroidales bacterium]
MRKSLKEIKLLENAFKKINKMGILIHASIVFGFDNDTNAMFEDTVQLLIKNNVSTVSFNVLIPYPGTRIYEKIR